MTLRNILDEYFARLNMSYGLLYHLQVQLGMFRRNTKDRIDRGEIKGNRFGAGTSLAIRDLTEWPSHGWAVYYPSGHFATMGDEFFALTDKLVAREAAWTVAQAFEAFETVALDLLASAIYEHGQLADQDVVERHRRKLLQMGMSLDETSFWQTLIRREYRNVDGALEAIRSIASSLREAEQANNRFLNLREWFDALSEVRHAVTHSNQLVKRSRLDKMSCGSRTQLFTAFTGISNNKGYELQISVKQADEAITMLAEYGYSLFKALCIAANVEWRVFPRQGVE